MQILNILYKIIILSFVNQNAFSSEFIFDPITKFAHLYAKNNVSSLNL